MAGFFDIFAFGPTIETMNLFAFFRRRKPAPPSRPVSPDLSYIEDNAPHMTKLYSKVLGLMEEKRPWLDGDFCVGQLAKRLFCSRSVLSKTINICSGHNFRWLVNYYRIIYAAALMKKDPYMKIEEVAKLSGFNTLPTFNSAFKLMMKERPSEYMARVREATLPRRLPSMSRGLRP